MPHVEALLFAAERPLTLIELTDYLGTALEIQIIERQVAAAVEAVEEKYSAGFYPFGIARTGGGYSFLTKPEYHGTVLQLNGDKHLKKLSAAALETLAIIAYKSPVTRGDVEAIRGVSADYALQKLLEKDLVHIVGRDEESVGKPLLYAPSRHFLDYLGIASTADLPPLRELMPAETVVPTDAAEAVPLGVAAGTLLVSEDGELHGEI